MTTFNPTHRLGLCVSLAGVVAFTVACGGASTNTDSGNSSNTDGGSMTHPDAGTGAPAKNSGTEVYFPRPTSTTTYGTVPTVGQVVEIKGLKWSPYQNVNQFEASAATTTVTVLGNAALPPPVMLPASMLTNNGVSASGYEGMRVQVTGGPFTVKGGEGSLSTCPTALQYSTEVPDAGSGVDAGSSSTYCDGFSADDSSNTSFNVQTFAFGGTLKTEGCSAALETQADGMMFTTLSGIFDLDTSDNGTGSPVAALFPGDCVDLGQTGYTAPAGATFTKPTDGSTTIAAAYATNPATGIYGVVTAINPWAYNSSTDQDSGELYIQDL